MKANQEEILLLSYIYKKYKIDVKNQYYKGIYMQLNKIQLVVEPNEENDRILADFLQVNPTSIALTNSKIFTIEYDKADKNIQKAIVLHAQENMKEIMKKMNKFPDSTIYNIINHLETVNGAIDIAVVLAE